MVRAHGSKQSEKAQQENHEIHLAKNHVANNQQTSDVITNRNNIGNDQKHDKTERHHSSSTAWPPKIRNQICLNSLSRYWQEYSCYLPLDDMGQTTLEKLYLQKSGIIIWFPCVVRRRTTRRVLPTNRTGTQECPVPDFLKIPDFFLHVFLTIEDSLLLPATGKNLKMTDSRFMENARTLSKIDFPYRPTIEDKCYCQQREWEIKTSAPGFQENTWTLF